MKSLFLSALLVTVSLEIAAIGCSDSPSNNDDTDSRDFSSATDTTSDTKGTVQDTASDTGKDYANDTSSSHSKETDVDSDTNAPSIWGWISAIEWNDTCDQWYNITDWVGGVRAYFAETVTYPRALPHTLDFIPQVSAEGSCRLYSSGIVENCEAEMEGCEVCVDFNYECWRHCGDDQECHEDDTTWEGVCEDLPEHWDLGTITLSGFKESITLAPDKYDRYATVAELTNPNDLFDDGDILTATTQGGAVLPLSFTAKGVAPLEIPVARAVFQADNSTVVSWTPADDDARIQVAIMAGSHDPNPLTATIVCDVSDSDGSVEIPAGLINEFLSEICSGWQMKCSRITRYHRDVQTINGKEIEFFVGSARNLENSLFEM